MIIHVSIDLSIQIHGHPPGHGIFMSQFKKMKQTFDTKLIKFIASAVLLLLLSLKPIECTNADVSFLNPSREWKTDVDQFQEPPKSNWGSCISRRNQNGIYEKAICWGGQSGTDYIEAPWQFAKDHATEFAIRAKASSQYCYQDGWCSQSLCGYYQMQADGNALACGDASCNWTPLESDSNPVHIIVGFEKTVKIPTECRIYEAYNTPMVQKIEYISETSNNWTVIWEGNDTTTCPGQLVASFDDKSVELVGLRITTSHPSWEEINAVSVSGLVTNVVSSEELGQGTDKPSGNIGQASIYIPSSDCMLVFGGRRTTYNNDLWLYCFATSTWQKVIPDSSSNPSARYGHSLTALTSNASTTAVLFGGRTSVADSLAGGDDIWFLSAIKTNISWTKIEVSQVDVPIGRFAAGFIGINSTHAILFGGRREVGSVISTLNDTWVLNVDTNSTSRWSRIAVKDAPSNRSHFGFTLLPGTNRAILVGGMGNFNGKVNLYNDVWELDIVSFQWRLLSNYTDSALVPKPWAEMAMTSFISDLSPPSLLVYGGRQGSSVFALNDMGINSVWILSVKQNGISWTRYGQQPAQRSDHISALFESRYFIVTGGRDRVANKWWPLNEIWEYDLDKEEWNIATVTGEIPSARAGASSVLFSDTLLVFGGIAQTGSYMNELWRLEKTGASTYVWFKITVLSTSLPSPRAYHSAVLAKNEMILFGGLTNSGLVNDMWSFSFSNMIWQHIIQDVTPKARYGHAFTMADSDSMIVFGGSSSQTVTGDLSDVWIYTISNGTWTKQSLTMREGGGEFARAIMVGGMVGYVGGRRVRGGRYGGNANVIDGSLYAVNLNSSSPSFVRLAYSSPQRYSHSAFTRGTTVYEFGGSSLYELNDLKEFSLGRPCNNSGGGILTPEMMKEDYSETQACVPCSPGTGFYIDQCRPCNVGYYSDDFGNECTKCPDGTFGKLSGGIHAASCFPCPWGTVFNGEKCVSCPDTMFCGLASTQMLPKYLSKSGISDPTNPKAIMSNDQEIYTLITLIVAASFIILGVILALFGILRCWSKALWQRMIIPFDLFFTSQHSVPHRTPVVHRKTVLGGCLSVLFVISVLIVGGAVVVPFAVGNDGEERTLLPSNLQKSSERQFNATAIAAFHGYTGQCDDTTVSFDSKGLSWLSSELLFVSNSSSCQVQWNCKNCTILFTSSYIQIRIKGNQAYSHAIQWYLEANSGIPKENSTISGTISSPEKRVLRGPTPSIVKLRVIPTQFFSRKNLNSGFGVQIVPINQDISANVTESTFGWTRDVAVQFSLEETETTLSVTRFEIQRIQNVAASFLGGTSGLLGLFVLILHTLEILKNKVKTKQAEKKDRNIQLDELNRPTPPELYGQVYVLGKEFFGLVQVWRKREVSCRFSVLQIQGEDEIPMSSVLSIEETEKIIGAPEKVSGFGFVLHCSDGRDIELIATSGQWRNWWIRALESWREYGSSSGQMVNEARL